MNTRQTGHSALHVSLIRQLIHKTLDPKISPYFTIQSVCLNRQTASDDDRLFTCFYSGVKHLYTVFHLDMDDTFSELDCFLHTHALKSRTYEKNSTENNTESQYLKKVLQCIFNCGTRRISK